MEEVTADVIQTARELELELECEDVTEWLHLMAKLEQMRSCFLWMSKEGGSLGWHLLLVKIVEMTTKGLEYDKLS